MATTSRVNNALPRSNASEGLAFKQHIGQTKTALIGNGSGAIYVPATTGTLNYGKVWIRLFEGVGANGETLTSAPKRAYATGMFYPAENMPVKVRENTVTGVYDVVGNDVLGAAQRSLNTNGLNPQSPSNNEIWLRQVRNMRGYFPTSNTTSSTKLSIEPYLYIYNGVLKYAEKGQTDNVDLSSYIPSAGNERLIGTAIKASDNTVQIVAGTTRTISSADWALSNLQELVDLFDSDVMPEAAYAVSDAQTSLDKTNRVFDLRQFINVPQQAAAAGSSNIIDQDALIPSGKDAFFAGGLNIIAGTLTVTGELYIL